jgi:RND family efflux transporter MFP subunit
MTASARRWLLALALLAAAAGAGGGAWWAWREAPLELETAPVERGSAIEAVAATGAVEPSVLVPVAPRSAGRLAEIAVDEGARVRRGQLLARLEVPDLERSIDELRARERLARAQAERAGELVARGFLSSAELDRTRAELDAAAAALARAQAQRDYALLLAPADGSVLRRDGEVGQFVAAGQTVLTLACCAPLRVTAEVDEEDIVRVQPGQAVAMRANALPELRLAGAVQAITPKGDPVARSYRVRIALDDAARAEAAGLRSGMTVDVNIVVARREAALLLPARAVVGADKTVWVVDAAGRLARRDVQLRAGGGGAGRSEIAGGLEEGAQVVLGAPQPGWREGRRVTTARRGGVGARPAGG